MSRIVTTTYRYKPPPRKRKAVAPEVVVTRSGPSDSPPTETKTRPAIVRKPKPGNDNRPDPAPDLHPTAGTKAAPALLPIAVRGEAAAGLWRELVRRATGKP
jgi:hypothetical protein